MKKIETSITLTHDKARDEKAILFAENSMKLTAASKGAKLMNRSLSRIGNIVTLSYLLRENARSRPAPVAAE